jgi:hypothetical protein
MNYCDNVKTHHIFSMKYMHSSASHNNSSGGKCQFAICKICFWCATVFRSAVQDTKNNNSENNIIHTCPMCSNNNISLITIANDIELQLVEGKQEDREIEQHYSPIVPGSINGNGVVIEAR